ncbi:hypothetical protein [Paracoccus beibuensis]|uniref:hypothetical protein n=1 Tax=Paracoccus beibuensis TaxID=547602 RepID=UPI00223F39C0|nr:hypothetical protein [Paracoccus beibuensis]
METWRYAGTANYGMQAPWPEEYLPIAAIKALAAERDAAVKRAEAAEAERDQLAENTNRFPDLMARILAAKDQPLPARIGALVAAMQKMPADFLRYQWEAASKPLFGEKRVAVYGNNGQGTGRQYIADTPSGRVANVVEIVEQRAPGM